MESKPQEFYTKIIAWAKRRGDSALKANKEGFERPASFTSTQTNTEVVPDASGVSLGAKSYFEIVGKQESSKATRRLVARLKLLATMAKYKGGKLFMFVPYGHKKYAQEIIKKQNLEGELVSLNLRLPSSK